MKHHGIKVNPRLVPALLDGTKTMHVERIGPQPRWQEDPVLDDGHWVGRYQCQYYSPNSENGEVGVEVDAVKSPIQPGDVVFLQEEWVISDDPRHAGVPQKDRVLWKSSHAAMWPRFDEWQSAESLPYALSRWHATVKSVEAKRLQDITVPEARLFFGSSREYCDGDDLFAYWEEKHPGSWENNEWFWIYTFERRE